MEPLPDETITGTEYADLTVRQGSRVQADLRLDPPKQHLYVMTEKKVSPPGFQPAQQGSVSDVQSLRVTWPRSFSSLVALLRL